MTLSNVPQLLDVLRCEQEDVRARMRRLDPESENDCYHFQYLQGQDLGFTKAMIYIEKILCSKEK